MTPSDCAQKLKAQFGDLLSDPVEFRGEITLILTDPEQVESVGRYAKGQLGFDYLVDIASVDHGDTEPRFTVVYELYGYGHHCALRIKTSVSEEQPELPTVSGVWRTANWHEREIYDMMGIRFRNHPDLRRILMWDGYPYFPLRKDFPLAGKDSEVPEVAFTEPAPMEGGPFVSKQGGKDSIEREPRIRSADSNEGDEHGSTS